MLKENNIVYHWLGEQLGGYRSGGYETYTHTAAFQQGLEELTELAQHQKTAIMCAI
ncbi:MAG: DUF488 domain-containing protein [bacterium]